MILLNGISQTLVYLCFAILMGSFIFYLIPSTLKPTIQVPKTALVLSAIGIALFSFVPVLQILLHLLPNGTLGESLQSVLLTFEVGKAWLFTFIVSAILLIYIFLFDFQEKKIYSFLGLTITFILILALGWSSHASSYTRLWGFIGDTLHFTAVSVWVGILLVVSWFSLNYRNWLKFLNWFSPVALACFAITIVSGLLLMNIIVGDYTNSWPLSYGQTLLIKHLLIIPLIVFALLNGIFIKKMMKSVGNFNPLPWVKAESLLMLLIFSATASLGQQMPPRETIISAESVSYLFNVVYQGQIHQNMAVQFAPNATAITLGVLALLFLLLMFVSFMKKMPAIMTFLMGIFLVFSCYLSLILSIQ